MSPNSKIAALRKISDQIPNSADLAILQTYIVNLMSAQRSSFDFAVPIPPPNAYDVLIQDINPTTLSVIGEELGVISLSQTSATPNFPVRGILFGQCQRAFVPFIVMKREISINVTTSGLQIPTCDRKPWLLWGFKKKHQLRPMFSFMALQ